jgi:aminopeptidase N
MTTYRVTLRADRAASPVLLSNGNLLSQRDLPDGRHEAVWEDPFRKPSYLFALVAGKLERIEETIVSARARKSCCRSGSNRRTWTRRATRWTR